LSEKESSEFLPSYNTIYFFIGFGNQSQSRKRNTGCLEENVSGFEKSTNMVGRLVFHRLGYFLYKARASSLGLIRRGPETGKCVL
jgi:hypothetical protein